MSSPNPPNRLNTVTTWYFGIPWSILYIRRVLENAAPTTDEVELDLRKNAMEADEEDSQDHLFDWAYENVGAVINRNPDLLTCEDCVDHLKTYSKTVLVLVLRKKIVQTQDQLKDGLDLHRYPPPTDDQVEELKNRGWIVDWYKAVEQ
ncbi:hypothetical protein GSI_08588 [Ganoderma sinense ZZ0214-1]|uniref:Uncharacterized protein n=1 Tax=Ganoderma sinense ZZ0214-1 TaxID=1077348 RepID=A0A2G8S490_9APHY|nr:hypothetical protein GSI_08588 [Ganoderma sinense ZZ0214-1]